MGEAAAAWVAAHPLSSDADADADAGTEPDAGGTRTPGPAEQSRDEESSAT